MACTPHDLDEHDPDVVDSVFVEAGLPGFAANALLIAYVRISPAAAFFRRVVEGTAICWWRFRTRATAIALLREVLGFIGSGVFLLLTLAWTYRRQAARRASRIAGSARASSGFTIGSKLTILANCSHRFQASSSLASVLCAAALRSLSARAPQRRESVLMSTRKAIAERLYTSFWRSTAIACIASRAGVEVLPGGRHGAERVRYSASLSEGCTRGGDARSNRARGCACAASASADACCACCCR
eukprot:2380898-Pleurochrysis_carterae.AAC.2